MILLVKWVHCIINHLATQKTETIFSILFTALSGFQTLYILLPELKNSSSVQVENLSFSFYTVFYGKDNRNNNRFQQVHQNFSKTKEFCNVMLMAMCQNYIIAPSSPRYVLNKIASLRYAALHKFLLKKVFFISHDETDWKYIKLCHNFCFLLNAAFSLQYFIDAKIILIHYFVSCIGT